MVPNTAYIAAAQCEWWATMQKSDKYYALYKFEFKFKFSNLISQRISVICARLIPTGGSFDSRRELRHAPSRISRITSDIFAEYIGARDARRYKYISVHYRGKVLRELRDYSFALSRRDSGLRGSFETESPLPVRRSHDWDSAGRRPSDSAAKHRGHPCPSYPGPGVDRTYISGST